MKKWIAFVLAFVCVLSIVGCSSKTSGGTSQIPTENNRNDEKPNKRGITLGSDNITVSGLTVVCSHSGGENVAELYPGSYYVIQK